MALLHEPSSAASPVAPTLATSGLNQTLGVGIATNAPVGIDFARPMDMASVATSLQVWPATTTPTLSWSADATHLAIRPAPRWQSDQRYVVLLPATTLLADGSVLGAPFTYGFTTRRAPFVSGFEVDQVMLAPEIAQRPDLQAMLLDPTAPPPDTAAQASAGTVIRITFSAPMNRAEVERAFLVSPTVHGSFVWDGTTIIFTPSRRLKPGARYAVSLVGARDVAGNPLSGDTSFSLTTYAATRVVKVVPAEAATGVSAGAVTIAFSAPADTTATGAAFGLVDRTTGKAVTGSVTWNATGTRLTFTPRGSLAAGHRFEVRLAAGAVDLDGNPLTTSSTFTTRVPPPPRPATIYPPPSASSSAAQYALALINASRKAYGFAPLRLDAALSAVATAHARDQITYDYFSHVSRDGSTFVDRLNRAGISFSHAGENQCLDYGSMTSALDWCHSVMMAEPYPGVWNHIANILDPNFTRVGFGYGRASNGKLIMTWDFAG